MKPDTPDELRHMLHEWSDVPVPDSGLAALVQRDVAAGTNARRAGAGSIIPLRFAVVGVALGVLVGAAAVEWRKSRVEETEMPQRYLAWIDPLSTSKEMR